MTRLIDQDFDAFNASGFSPLPMPGQLDSLVWRVGGLSDSPAPAYGFTGASGTDFGRGLITTNDPTAAGVYAPAADPALVIQPTGAEFDAGGFIETRLQNNSGANETGFVIGFDWVYRNSAPRADTMTFSYSIDGTNFTPLPAADFSSPAASDAGADFTHVGIVPISLGNVTLAPNQSLTLRWTHTSSSGAGNRDEIGIDNLTVDAQAGGTLASDPSPVPPPSVRNLVPIFDLQGAGDTSSFTGQTVTMRGVVTAISNGSSKGFYLQDPQGDGNEATSDGIFVFTGSVPAGIAVGDLLEVIGNVSEFRPSGAAPGALSTTELSGVTATTILSRDNALPAPVVIGPGVTRLPDSDIAAANAAYERLEGMLVTVQDPLVVGPTNAFGEIFTVAGGGANASGLNARGDLLISAGAPVLGFTDSAGGDQNPERIQIDPGLGVTLPRVDTGASLSSVTGVVGYDFGDYQVLATAAPTVTRPSPLTKDAATLTGDGTHLLVGSYNAENLDPGDGAARFATIAGEIIGKLNAPDVIALQEVQDNNGATDNGVTSAALTLQMIVDAIAAAGGPAYVAIDNPFIGNDSNGGEPGGNIRTAFLYRPDRVGFVPGSLATVAADGRAITSGNYNDQQTDPDNPFFASRPPLSAGFVFNGQTVTVLSNHFTSKGGSGALYGAVQPPFDGGEVQRAAQAQAVNTYVDGLLAADPNARVVVAGDLNDFGFEQPLSVLKGSATLTGYDVPGTDPIRATATYTPGGAQVLTDLQDTLPADQRFDYLFEGNAETLDHMLVSASLAAGAAFQPVHINSEFADQTSDHDPLVGRFSVPGAPPTENPMPTPLNILLTNDDGYNAPGIQTLYTALVGAGFNVHIVAPAANQSAQGSSFGGTQALSSPVAITQFSPGNYFVDGRPATATLAALNDLFAGSKPDLVISGTNRGDNIGESENISGTVNAALQGLFEGVPAIAVSAGSFNGSYDAAFANSANFMVDFLHELQANQASGQPILPAGQGLSINVPGNPALSGVAVTTVTPESSAAFPYAPSGTSSFAEGFVTNTTPSGSPTAEGSRFLQNDITISPIDGNWGSTEADRAALAVHLGGLSGSTVVARPLNILLLNEDGANAAGIVATRQALLQKGYNVTVLAPTTDQSGVGSALFLNPVTVTQFDAGNYAANGTPATLVALGLDPKGLFNGARPDLVVVGADQGDAVGIENANHSATLAGAITALFNYEVPAIALSSKTGSVEDVATGAGFLTNLIGNLQATQGSAASLLPGGVGLSINVPSGASAGNFAFTTIDGGTDSSLGLAGGASSAVFVAGGAVPGSDGTSEGDAFNAGKITVSPIDGNIAVPDPDAYTALAQSIGTPYGSASAAPATLMFQVSEDAFQGDARFLVTVNGHQIGGPQTATVAHTGGQTSSVTLLDFFDTDIRSVGVTFINDAYGGTDATDRNLYVDKLTLNGKAAATLRHIGDSRNLNAIVNFLPLILALKWTETHADEFPEKTGERWMADFFKN